MFLDIASRLHQGLSREDQQDNLLVLPLGLIDQRAVPNSSATDSLNGLALLVSDGMGGMRSGKLASSLAISEAKKLFLELSHDPGPFIQNIESSLRQLLLKVNNRIIQESLQDDNHFGMGATLVIAIVYRDNLFISWLGDSRLYVYRDSQMIYRTEDHSKVQELIKAGVLSEAEARHHPESNIVTRSLGMKKIEASFHSMQLKDQDILLLSTDGLHGMLDDATLLDVIKSHSSMEELAIDLEKKALQEGGLDNIGLIVGRATMPPEESRPHQPATCLNDAISKHKTNINRFLRLWVPLILLISLALVYLLYYAEVIESQVDTSPPVLLSEIIDSPQVTESIILNADDFHILIQTSTDPFQAQAIGQDFKQKHNLDTISIRLTNRKYEISIPNFRSREEAQQFASEKKLESYLIINAHKR